MPTFAADAEFATTIPRIVHQTSRTELTDPRWKSAIKSVRHFHPGWEYRLWTHKRSLAYVDQFHPQLAPIFRGFERNIMRADVIRYVVMHDLGGVYCDLDYEFLRPYSYAGSELVLALEFDSAYGDIADQIAGFVFASRPGHPFWHDVLEAIRSQPPSTNSYHDVVDATGPGFLTRIYKANRDRYNGVRVEPRPAFNPLRARGRQERAMLLNNGVTYGLHHACGSWKERWKLAYFRQKIEKLLVPQQARRSRSAA